jgi:hypothetical protein
MNVLTKILPFALLSAGLGSPLSASILQLGESAELHRLADVDYVYTDNLFRQVNARADDYMEFSPGIELRLSEGAAASAVLRYQHRFTEFSKFNGLDGDYSDLSLQARYNSGRILTAGYLEYVELASNTVDVNLDGVLIERDQLDGGANLKFEMTELTAFEVGIDYTEVDYDLPQYADHEDVSVPITLFYRIRPKIDLTAGVRFRDVSTSVGTDYSDLYYYVGAVGEFFSPVLYADITIGFQEREFDSIDYDTSAASYDITFIYTGDVKTTLYLGLSQDYRSSADGGGSYTYTSGTLGARYSLTDVFGFNASIALAETDYDLSPRAEDITIVEVGATYNPNDYLTIRASYLSQDVDGKDPVFSSDYKTNTFRVSASVRY